MSVRRWMSAKVIGFRHLLQFVRIESTSKRPSVMRGVTILFVLIVLSILTRVCFLATTKTLFSTTRNAKISKFNLPSRFKDKKSIWTEYNELALQYKPLDLGQGFPDYVSENMTNALATVAKSDNPLLHQYTREFGYPRLVNVLAKFYSKFIKRDLDPNKEIVITFGAFQALYTTLQSFTNPGDEWIIIEPFFDSYVPMVESAQGIPRFIALKPKTISVTSGDWVFDRKEMKSLFNKKTKGIIFNTPHNPTGKVFTLDELQFIAKLARKWNVLVVSDEVYEHIVYDPYKHIRIATLPGMYERTITIGSASKTFGVTGWRIGWAYGPANLLHNLQVVHQTVADTCTTPIQEAIAIAFELEMECSEQPECYFHNLRMKLLPKRDYMAKFLREIGMVPTIPEGGYFMLANWSSLENKTSLQEETDENKDYRFTKWMIKNIGLQGLPLSAFYNSEQKTLTEDYVRYCFNKKDDNLERAADILRKWASQ